MSEIVKLICIKEETDSTLHKRLTIDKVYDGIDVSKPWEKIIWRVRNDKGLYIHYDTSYFMKLSSKRNITLNQILSEV
jgi:hypothetical protein